MSEVEFRDNLHCWSWNAREAISDKSFFVCDNYIVSCFDQLKFNVYLPLVSSIRWMTAMTGWNRAMTHRPGTPGPQTALLSSSNHRGSSRSPGSHPWVWNQTLSHRTEKQNEHDKMVSMTLSWEIFYKTNHRRIGKIWIGDRHREAWLWRSGQIN